MCDGGQDDILGLTVLVWLGDAVAACVLEVDEVLYVVTTNHIILLPVRHHVSHHLHEEFLSFLGYEPEDNGIF